MILPGVVLSGITFPGVMVHEFAHELMCHLTGTRVLKVCYFRLGDSSGYVLSEKPSNIWKSFLISFVPFIFNSGTGFLSGLASAAFYREAGRFDFVSATLFYLGVALAFHAFPSLQDAKVIDDELWKKETGLVAKFICAPVVLLFALKAIVDLVLLDMIWGLTLGGIFPFLYLGIR
jgi:hypothetical protein